MALPDDRLGERVCAVVIPKRRTLTLADLAAHVSAGGHSATLRPEALFFVDHFEFTDTGKVRRKILQQWAIDGLAAGAVETLAGASP